MRFDAYCATFQDLDAHQLAEDVQTVVEDAAGGVAMVWEPTSAKHGYAHAVQLLENTGQKRRHCFAVLRYGGNGGTSNVEVKGEPSAAFATWCRGRYPSHRVSRADVCIDLAGPGLYEAGAKALYAIADERRLKTEVAGDWHRGDAGRTLYLGARKSDFRVVWYEKGKQLIGDGLSGADPLHARLELKVRCAKTLKRAMAAMEHGDVWGLTEWSRAALEAVSGIDAQRIHVRTWRQPDDARAFHWCSRQYGELLQREARRLGGWEALGAAMADEMAPMQKPTRRAA